LLLKPYFARENKYLDSNVKKKKEKKRLTNPMYKALDHLTLKIVPVNQGAKQKVCAAEGCVVKRKEMAAHVWLLFPNSVIK
jgi:hypothetical protein